MKFEGDIKIEAKDKEFFDMSKNIIIKAQKRLGVLEGKAELGMGSKGNAPWKMVAGRKKGLGHFAKAIAGKGDLGLDEVGPRESGSFNLNSLGTEPGGTPRTGVGHKLGNVWDTQSPHVHKYGRNARQSNGQELLGLPLKTEASAKHYRNFSNGYKDKFQDQFERQTNSRYLSQVLPDSNEKDSKRGMPDPKKSMVDQL